ncbi:DUF2848 domain-containing protein [Bradyrhizobium sp. CCBAU 51745]|uniref:DUF2848 domain-containing protein n=1 Tax=Bradyrhizobium sp. CCBAU 51745 TaxID=1325099 RepID=UPI0023056D4D|nr:DUF2848 domain-containing protein [Bradyrhizobium sp. CCBAU 51745]
MTKFDALIVSERGGAADLVKATIRDLIIAGWTGRNEAALLAHIEELEKLGVPRPKTTPIFYRVASSLLTMDEMIEVVGSNSSGEVEPVLMRVKEGVCLGLGSDHTDRKIETIGITISKQSCPKPIGRSWWLLADVEDHWDQLQMRSYAVMNGERRLYQEGSLKAMRHPHDLMTRCFGAGSGLPMSTAMFCGTLPVHGAIEHGDAYELELADPVLGRALHHSYTVKTLPTE